MLTLSVCEPTAVVPRPSIPVPSDVSPTVAVPETTPAWAVEKLNAKGLCRAGNRGLRRAIHDASLAEIRRQLTYSTTSGSSCKSAPLCFEDLAGVSPLERSGGLVVGLDERKHLLSEVSFAGEDAVLEQSPVQD